MSQHSDTEIAECMSANVDNYYMLNNKVADVIKAPKGSMII